MVDITMITGAVASLKTAVDIAATVKEINDLTVVRNKVIEMQGLILNAQGTAVAAQSQMLEMVHEIAELKAKLAEVEEWKVIAARYRLIDYGGNTLAYELREDADTEEPQHRICPVCFEQRRKSILQFRYKTTSSQQKFKCIPCNAEYEFGDRLPAPRPQRVNRRGSWMAD